MYFLKYSVDIFYTSAVYGAIYTAYFIHGNLSQSIGTL